jgi:Zn-dependent peptidase ImmA (M78 family)
LNIAVKKALEVLTLHGLLNSYIDLRDLTIIVEKEGMISYKFPFQGRLKERYFATSDGIVQIAVASDISSTEQKHMIAHALGHHFLHQGNHAHINCIFQDKQEHQADVFAAVLLVPPSILMRIRPSSALELAREYGIPLVLAEKRLDIYNEHKI